MPINSTNYHVWIFILKGGTQHQRKFRVKAGTDTRVQPLYYCNQNMSIPSLRAKLIRSPAVPATTIYLATVLAGVETKGASAFAFAVLRATFAAVPRALLRGLQDCYFGSIFTISKWSLQPVLICSWLCRRRGRCVLVLSGLSEVGITSIRIGNIGTRLRESEMSGLSGCRSWSRNIRCNTSS